MIDAGRSSFAIPEFPSPERQRLTMALRALSALAQGRLDEAEQCLDALDAPKTTGGRLAA